MALWLFICILTGVETTSGDVGCLVDSGVLDVVLRFFVLRDLRETFYTRIRLSVYRSQNRVGTSGCDIG